MGNEGRANDICAKLDRLDEVPCRKMRKGLIRQVWGPTSHSECVIDDKRNAMVMGNLCDVNK